MASLLERWPREKALRLRSVVDLMGLCSCGTNAHWKCILELLQEAKNHNDRGFYRDQWFEFGAKVLNKFHLIEHGTGIGFAWLTEDGKLLLEFLQDFGIEDHDMTDNSGHPFWSIEFSWRLEPEVHDAYDEWANSPAPAIPTIEPAH